MKVLGIVAPLLLAAPAWAQQAVPDSVKVRELDKLTVEGSAQRTSVGKSVYYPDARQKNAAQDAVSLLGLMAIPQINVDLATNSIKTPGGDKIAVFIDYVAATSADMHGMRPADVKQVEYLINPTDARFNGARYVVNFIMHRYEWGGYTKLNGDKSVGVNRNEVSAYSKFAYKKMTFDLYADEIYLADRHSGSDSEETFRFTDFEGQGATGVVRTLRLLDSDLRMNSNSLSLRALYNTPKAQISNRLTLGFDRTPHNDAEYKVSYSPNLLPAGTASSMASSRKRNLDDVLDYYSPLGSRLALKVTGHYRHDYVNASRSYSAREQDIVNDAVERTDYASLAPLLVWRPSETSTVIPYAQAEYSKTMVDYMGYSPSRQSYDIFGAVAGARYAYTRQTWSAGTQLRWVYAYTDLSGTRIIDNYPQGDVFGSYSPNSRNQFEGTYSFGKRVPGTYQKSPNMLRQDELMWYAGTPDLANAWNHSLGGVYTWLPSNRWQFAMSGNYFTALERVVPVYIPDAPGGTMLRRYLNNGDYNYANVQLTATGKFFNNRLVARLSPFYSYYGSTGDYTLDVHDFAGSAQITWYFGNCYLFGWYRTPVKDVASQSGVEERSPSSYMLQFGWSHGAWNVKGVAFNFLRSSWESGTQILHSRYYDSYRREYGTAGHMRFQLAVTYTVGYGKKVQRGDEIGGAAAGSSAILK